MAFFHHAFICQSCCYCLHLSDWPSVFHFVVIFCCENSPKCNEPLALCRRNGRDSVCVLGPAIGIWYGLLVLIFQLLPCILFSACIATFWSTDIGVYVLVFGCCCCTLAVQTNEIQSDANKFSVHTDATTSKALGTPCLVEKCARKPRTSVKI